MSFHKLDFHPYTWMSRYKLEAKVINQSMLDQVLSRCGKYLKSVHFSLPCENQFVSENIKTPESVCKILLSCPNLEQLVATPLDGRSKCSLKPFECENKQHKIVSLLRPLKDQITKLVISIRDYCDIEEDFHELIKEMKNLKSIHIDSWLCRPILEASQINQLEEFSFKIDVFNIRETSAISILKNNNKLKSVKIYSYYFYILEPIITVLKSNTGLKELVICGEFILNTQTVLSYLSQLSNLQTLSFKCMNGQINDSYLLVISENCKNLEILDISSCFVSDEGLTQICYSLQKLRVFLMADVHEAKRPPFAKLKNLEKLDCSYCQRLRIENSLGPLVLSARNLRVLNLTNCLRLDQTLLDLAHIAVKKREKRHEKIALNIIISGTGIHMNGGKTQSELLNIINEESLPWLGRDWWNDKYWFL